jgi:hypothetical protein
MADTERLASEANRLYWNTDTPVAEITDRLAVSRRALYAALDPFPTETSCETCGTPLVFLNRLRRAAGQAECLECGSTRSLAEQRAETADAGARIRSSAGGQGTSSPKGSGPSRAAARSGWPADPSLARRAAFVGGAALTGLAVGALVTVLITRRH